MPGRRLHGTISSQLLCALVVGVGLPALASWACVGTDPVPNESTPADGGAADVVRPPSNDGEDAAVACTAPLEACGSLCVDKQTNDQHCGRCDRACGVGSKCSATQCSAVELGHGIHSPTALVITPSFALMNVTVPIEG